MAQLNQKNDDDLRFDLQNSSSGSEGEAPPASTIYDPSVLAVSPEYRAKVAAREARNENLKDEQEKEDNVEAENSPFHVFSPVGPANARRPFEMGVDGKTIRASAGDIEEDRETEFELCCFGLVPFYPSLLLVNVLNFIIAMITLSIGSHQVQTGARAVVGFGSMERLVVSGPHITGVASVCIGILISVSAALGIYIAFSLWKASTLRYKWIELANHCLLILLAILCFVLFIANALGLSRANRNGGAYDDTLWTETVQAAPIYTCHTELRFGCAGLESNQCQFDANEISNSFCGGHFCIDFCKIATDDINPQEICDPCRETKSVSVFDLIACKDHEKNVTKTKGCKQQINDDLRVRYIRLLSASLLCFISVFVTITVTFYRLCCA